MGRHSCGSGLACGRRGSCRPWAARGTPTRSPCAEAFFATLDREVLDRYRFQTREEARSVLFSYLEASYNR
ncbi:MAG: IS3 family transposase, partial [Armatimonadota bacterium]|nr:IS3 family transposase [Armatimonadota bacterium]